MVITPNGLSVRRNTKRNVSSSGEPTLSPSPCPLEFPTSPRPPSLVTLLGRFISTSFNDSIRGRPKCRIFLQQIAVCDLQRAPTIAFHHVESKEDKGSLQLSHMAYSSQKSDRGDKGASKKRLIAKSAGPPSSPPAKC